MSIKTESMNRRRFVKNLSLLSAGLSVGGCAQLGTRPRTRLAFANEKLNLGFIGAGGRATANIEALAGENIVALCDVDDKNAAASFAKYPQAKRYRDFRKMLDDEK